jgi:hypothetical protein
VRCDGFGDCEGLLFVPLIFEMQAHYLRNYRSNYLPLISDSILALVYSQSTGTGLITIFRFVSDSLRYTQTWLLSTNPDAFSETITRWIIKNVDDIKGGLG